MDRLAAKVRPQYDALATELRQAPALHSDETSCWVAGPGGGCPSSPEQARSVILGFHRNRLRRDLCGCLAGRELSTQVSMTISLASTEHEK